MRISSAEGFSLHAASGRLSPVRSKAWHFDPPLTSLRSIFTYLLIFTSHIKNHNLHKDIDRKAKTKATTQLTFVLNVDR